MVTAAQPLPTLTMRSFSVSGTPARPSVMSWRWYTAASAIVPHSGYGPTVSSGISTQDAVVEPVPPVLPVPPEPLLPLLPLLL